MNFSVGVLQSPWCGLQNFEFLFKTKDAWIMIRNTLLYNIVWIAMGTVIAVFIAILMAEISARPAAKVIQPIICFPSMISAVILSFIVYAFLSTNNGYINRALLGGDGINWYARRTVLAGDPYNRSFLAMLGPELGYLYGKHRRHR